MRQESPDDSLIFHDRVTLRVVNDLHGPPFVCFVYFVVNFVGRIRSRLTTKYTNHTKKEKEVKTFTPQGSSRAGEISIACDLAGSFDSRSGTVEVLCNPQFCRITGHWLPDRVNQMRQESPDDSLIFQLGKVTKVDKQSKFQASGFEIVVDLSPMLVRECRYSLNLDDD